MVVALLVASVGFLADKQLVDIHVRFVRTATTAIVASQGLCVGECRLVAHARNNLALTLFRLGACANISMRQDDEFLVARASVTTGLDGGFTA